MAKHDLNLEPPLDELSAAGVRPVMPDAIRRLARALAAIASLEDELIELRVHLEELRPEAEAVLGKQQHLLRWAHAPEACARAVLLVLEKLGPVGVTGE